MGKNHFPQRVTIELTNRCNLACVFCHRTEKDMRLGDMREKLFKKIIDEMAEHVPISMVPFFRGESLLHPQFIEFIRYAKNKDIAPIQMTTNALVLDEKKSRDIIESGIDFISFSLDTLNEQKYNFARINGDLKKSMHNVIRFVNLCKEYNDAGKSIPEVQISTVDTEEYREEQEEFIDFWRKYADYVRVYEEHDINGQFRDRTLSEIADNIIDRRPCKKIYTDMVIHWDGSISLCCYDWGENHHYGDLNDNSINDIWNGEAMKKLRKMHEENTITADCPCYLCEFWKADYLEEGILGKKVIGDRKLK